MELFAMILVLFTLLSKVIAVNCGKPVCPQGGPYCTFTDAWRQFNYTYTLGHLVNPDNQTVQLHAYNWTCDQIGFSPAVEIGKHSTLTLTFIYAGKKYGQNATGAMLPNATCYISGGQYTCETQLGCGEEVNQGDFRGGKEWRETMIRTVELKLDEYGGERMKEL